MGDEVSDRSDRSDRPCMAAGWRRGGVLLLTALWLLQGCAARAPVESSGRSGALPPPAESEGRPAAVPSVSPAERQSVPLPQEGKAAGTLLASARQHMQAGRASQAEMALERALRLEPRNARLWHEMAQVKFAQRNFAQTVQFCLKSNSLAGRDQDLRRRNWQLLEQAYEELGEADKAREARDKAAG